MIENIAFEEMSDERLREIIVRSEDFLPSMEKGALDEARRRGINKEEIAIFKKVYAVKRAHLSRRREKSLNWYWWLIIVVFPVGMVQSFLYFYFSKRNFDKKASQCWTASWVGLFLWAVYFLAYIA